MQIRVVTELEFKERLKQKLGVNYRRAETVFINYGPYFSWEVACIILIAVEKGNILDVLATLKKHWGTHLMYQAPEVQNNDYLTKKMLDELRRSLDALP